MKPTTKRALLSAAGLMLTVGGALAADPMTAVNSTSTDIVGNLGFFSTLAGTIMTYSKYIAFFVAVLSLLGLWVSGMLAKMSKKINEAINAHDGLKNWLKEAVLVIVAFIILFNFVIPTINSMVPSVSV